MDSALTAEITLEKNVPVLTVRDDVSHSEIARVGYPIPSADISLCHEKTATTHSCDHFSDTSHVVFIGFDDSTIPVSADSSTLTLGASNAPLFQYVKGN